MRRGEYNRPREKFEIFGNGLKYRKKLMRRVDCNIFEVVEIFRLVIKLAASGYFA